MHRAGQVALKGCYEKNRSRAFASCQGSGRHIVLPTKVAGSTATTVTAATAVTAAAVRSLGTGAELLDFASGFLFGGLHGFRSIHRISPG